MYKKDFWIVFFAIKVICKKQSDRHFKVGIHGTTM